MKQAVVCLGMAVAGWIVVAQGVWAQPRRGYPPQIEGAKALVYKQVGEVKLRLWVFFPPQHRPQDRRAAVVFFFGGGWRSGTPAQFVPQARYLAQRGMVAAVADYRVQSRHGVSIQECVQDAKSAVRFLRAHAAELGVDPRRIVTSGGSAGGHLAIATAVLPDLEAPGEDLRISSSPNAVVAFNPAVVLAPIPGEQLLQPRQWERLARRAKGEPKAVSPYHHVRPKLPPMLILHGQEDRVVPLRSVELFALAMKKAGNRCQLKTYAKAGHGFFNYRRRGGRNPFFRQTLQAMDAFLTCLGYLPKPEGTPASAPR